MCGISGKLDWNEPPAISSVERMNNAMRHRGPDGFGVNQLGAVAFGQRRLAIIDLSEAGHQPMRDHTGRYWITFNGEIYNYQELKSELTKSGATFVSKTDTEVILEAFKLWGPQAVTRLNGMFAFAIWDTREQLLFLARDRLGKKPLFYHLTKAGLSFASELPALLADPDIPMKVNPRAVTQFLSIGYILGSECIQDDVKKLPPGHTLLWQRGRTPVVSEYWDLSKAFYNKRTFRNEEAAFEELRSLLEDSVKIRLMSDVPLGAFLSGGIDSSSVVAALRRFKSQEQSHTFSMGFNEKSFNELDEAQAAADALGVTHHSQFITDNFAADMEAIALCSGEPFADTSIIPMYYLSKFARQSVTVTLSGDGADEIFGGYETYVADRIHNVARFLPKAALSVIHGAYRALAKRDFGKVSMDYKILQFLRGCALPPARAHYSWRELFSAEELSGILQPDYAAVINENSAAAVFEQFDKQVAGCHYLDRGMYVDIKTWLPDDILVKVDRATMAHSLEARAPFLDYRLVEFAASLPHNLKVKGFSKKYALKASQQNILPDSILKRPKRGFNAPISQWLFSALRPVCEEIKRGSPVLDYINPKSFDRLLSEHFQHRVDNSFRLFSIINLHFWLVQFGKTRLREAA